MKKNMTGPMTVDRDKSFVVFLIGMRINSLWKVHKWWPPARAMGRMIKELSQNPDSGFLGFEQGLGNPTLMVQYWESTEKLMAYANDRSGLHFPAWAEFNKKIGDNPAVGIWHETYAVEPDAYECIYNHMPPFGLGKIGPLVPARGRLRTAKDRLAKAPKPLPLKSAS